MKLAEIATLNTGLVISRRLDNKAKNQSLYKVVTLKSLTEVGTLNMDELQEFYLSEITSDKYLTRENDIIMRFSYPHTAIRITKEQEGIVIPSQCVLIRLESLEFLPEYIRFYLNTEHVKREFARYTIGSALQIIKTSDIKELKIMEKRIEQQKQIIKAYSAISRNIELTKELLNEKINLLKSFTNKIYQGEKNEK